MMENGIVGYKKYFGFVLPDFIDEKQVNTTVGYVLVSLVMAFVLMLVVSPNREKVEVNKKLVTEETAKLANLKVSQASLAEAGEMIEPFQDLIFKAMPVDYSPEQAIYQLRRTATRTNVRLIDYTLPSGVIFDEEKRVPQTTGGDKAVIRFQSFPIKITVSGQISGILDFIDNVEKALPIGFVSDLNIKELAELARKTTAKETSLKLEVTYYQPVMLQTFNLTNLEQLTQEDIDLVGQLKTFNTGAGEGVINVETLPVETNVNSNLFGL